jgi:hypothetical protein
MEFLREEKPPKNDWREGMSQTTLVVVNIIVNINRINNTINLKSSRLYPTSCLLQQFAKKSPPKERLAGRNVPIFFVGATT